MAVPYLVFRLDQQRYALPASIVDRVVRRVEITPLQNCPPIISGIINVQGRVMPVFNIRRRFAFPEHPISLSDQLIIAHTKQRAVVLIVDQVLELLECGDQELIDTEHILPRIDYVKGVVKRTDGLILIHDLDTFLSLEEQTTLVEAMDEQ